MCVANGSEGRATASFDGVMIDRQPNTHVTVPGLRVAKDKGTAQMGSFDVKMKKKDVPSDRRLEQKAKLDDPCQM